MPPHPPRFICPYCHSPIDPGRMEIILEDFGEYRVCPECDAPIAVPPRMPVCREQPAQPCHP